MGLRERILEHDDISRETVDVPQWECKVEVRSMTVAERSRMMQQAADDAESGKKALDFTKLYPSIIIACVFDPETGDRVFTEEDAPALLEKSSGAVEPLAKLALALSGITEDGEASAGKG